MAKIKITNITQWTNEIVVKFELKEGGETEPRALAFPLGTSEKEIEKELKQYLKVYNEDKENFEEEKKRTTKELQNKKNLDTMKEALENKEIK